MAQPPVPIGIMPPHGKELIELQLLRRAPFKRLLQYALDRIGDGKLSYTPNTQLFNMSGQPAMSVPLHWSDDNLPVGVQFAARFGEEGLLFRLAI